ncbi:MULTISPECIES: NUDIX hydrolase [unclassified Paenibacillus]|uniref:NUDIX hydrolase n=1 Tax=unclassified Paenibacillus TaxID=185978 RepID=UPI002405CD28|nr:MULTISPECIES: NUDIX hydrolase [unclassified Paenibacillus]MDF9841275.1 8-oxo-dGTP pyrophosphatase MutT (NUDIX family) [Paenibacillus sp. PastF-2]MDF9847866.1 8-oxo-dGTP pyrophosphatase MutT (NUDIX family) [Paenibacillus sp. PastM-2]MDF9854434.1 8-oxo-dGTP pyrophosphatase MutT (NUDIX family) [Paenibacillus sp. PastF-1]MDH6479957.1 8-oxo-dGTP pyrophosphatase MutT (NUDIX family) [Paenibacillus sp. PastH-2]MDH6507141.1 8-oxo-dGTP pyrophosphatase MutT (NUDIX family) [Paenibacillus sp. PastM-3]
MTEYVKTMRRLIGNKPLLLCGASIIIFNELDQVLMLKRNDNGCWCFPGGAVDLGEDTEETARRELLEETGLSIGEVSLFGVFSGKDLHYVYPNGDEVYIVDVVYSSNNVYGEISVDNESREYRYFDIDDIPVEISPPVMPVVNELKGRGRA